MTRIGITGAPRCGKSTLARDLKRTTNARFESMPILCTDPMHLVKDLEPGVIYVPRDVYELAKRAGEAGDDTPERPWHSSSWYVATHFLTRPGPYVLEGVGLPRALRKFRAKFGIQADLVVPPLDKLIVLTKPRAPQLPGQVAQGKGCLTVLEELRPWLGDRLEWR